MARFLLPPLDICTIDKTIETNIKLLQEKLNSFARAFRVVGSVSDISVSPIVSKWRSMEMGLTANGRGRTPTPRTTE